MKFFSRSIILCFMLSLFIFIGAKSSLAKDVSNTDPSCVDLLLVFARGSSQNKEAQYLEFPFGDDFMDFETEAGTFFRKFQTLLGQNYPHVTYKAHSVHDFPGYNNLGYKAVPAFGSVFPFLTGNSLNAEFYNWSGDYRGSVFNGAEEVAYFVEHQSVLCPDQKIVLGGYSQGAEVVGGGLFKLSNSARGKIGGVALFGDPKFLAAKDGGILDGFNPFIKPKPYPWKRGTATDRDTGLLDPRDPYVPPGMESKTVSWCFEDDFVCAGASGFRLKNSAGHTRYATYGVPQAADEIFQKMTPQLYTIEKSRGGVDKEAGPIQPVPYQPNTKPIDVMFLVNFSAGTDDVLSYLRHETDSVIPSLNDFFSSIRYGVADFSELNNTSFYFPRYNFYQNLAPFTKPAMDSSPLAKSFSKLAYKGKSGGGADRADPLGLAVEKTAEKASWNPDATKHIILITDRPAKDPHTFNICNSTVWTNLHTWTDRVIPLTCTTDPAQTKYPIAEHPELCNTAWQVITRTECVLGMTEPSSTHNITRNLNDAIKIAQSKGVAVTIVVPHDYRPPNDPFDRTDVPKQLEYFAKATGGLFIKYDAFKRASYSDMIWQVLNHQPKQLLLTYHDALDTLGEGKTLSASTTVEAKTNVPTVFDVSTSPAPADTYKWDFDGNGSFERETQSPNVEHTFAEPTTNVFMQVVAYTGTEEQVRAFLPLTVTPYDGPAFDGTPPVLPEDIIAKQLPDGNLEISWTPGDPSVIIIIADPETGLPIASIPADEGRITIPQSYYANTTVRVLAATDNAESEPQIIEIELEQIELIVTDKSQGLGESSPWSQYLQDATTNSEVLRSQDSSYQLAANTPATTYAVAQTEQPKIQEAGTVLAEETKAEKSDVDQAITDRTNSTSDTLRIAAIAAMIIAVGILLGVLLILRSRG